MSLGKKILLSIFSISVLIATIGVSSNWYTNSILNQLVRNNVETTNMVELTATIENELYQSLITLIAIKEAQASEPLAITLSEPTEEMHLNNFSSMIEQIKFQIEQLNEIIVAHSAINTNHLTIDIAELNKRFQFYEQLSIEWLEFRRENREQSHQMFSVSITPYFGNNIIPIISHVREEVITQQNDENNLLDAQLKSAGIGIKIVTVFLVFMSIGIALFLYQSIANPLKKLHQGAQILGAGNLDVRVELSNNDEIGELADSFNTMASNLRKRTLARDYLDNIIESIHETLIVADEKGNIVGCNKAAEKLLGYKKNDLINKPLFQLFDSDHADIQKKTPQAVQNKTIETTIVANRDKKIPVLLSESNLMNSKEVFVGKVVVATDITERNKANARIRQSLKEKEILLAEIHHRVKNNLAVVSGILQLQSRYSKNKKVEAALTETQTRIKSISLVHEMLYQSDTMANLNYDEYVLDLILAISKLPLATDKQVKITAETQTVNLDLNIAVPCSLLLNEIIVDRLKNSFENLNQGTIHVILRNLDTSAELSVEHNGAKDSTKNVQESLGYTLIKTLINQLHGTYFEEFLEQRGVHRIRIVFPIDATLI